MVESVFDAIVESVAEAEITYNTFVSCTRLDKLSYRLTTVRDVSCTRLDKPSYRLTTVRDVSLTNVMYSYVVCVNSIM